MNRLAEHFRIFARRWDLRDTFALSRRNKPIALDRFC